MEYVLNWLMNYDHSLEVESIDDDGLTIQSKEDSFFVTILKKDYGFEVMMGSKLISNHLVHREIEGDEQSLMDYFYDFYAEDEEIYNQMILKELYK